MVDGRRVNVMQWMQTSEEALLLLLMVRYTPSYRCIVNGVHLIIKLTTVNQDRMNSFTIMISLLISILGALVTLEYILRSFRKMLPQFQTLVALTSTIQLASCSSINTSGWNWAFEKRIRKILKRNMFFWFYYSKNMTNEMILKQKYPHCNYIIFIATNWKPNIMQRKRSYHMYATIYAYLFLYA